MNVFQNTDICIWNVTILDICILIIYLFPLYIEYIFRPNMKKMLHFSDFTSLSEL